MKDMDLTDLFLSGDESVTDEMRLNLRHIKNIFPDLGRNGLSGFSNSRGTDKLPSPGGNAMTEHKQHSFDACCKFVLRHAAANAYKAKHRRASRLVTFSALSEKEMAQMCSFDDYSIDKQTYSTSLREVQLRNDSLCLALDQLTQHQREILLLAYCFELSDAEIADFLEIPRSTAQYRRRAALNKIRKLMEVSNEHKNDKTE